MALTTGVLMLCGGMAGIIVLVVILMILAHIFRKQRERLLNEIKDNR